MSLEALNTWLRDSPYYSRYGFKLVQSKDNSLILELPSSEKIIGNPAIKAIHGGIVAMTLELVATLETKRQASVNYKAIGQSTSYLHRTTASSLFASAQVVKLGRRFATVDATVWQKNTNKPVARALVTLQAD